MRDTHFLAYAASCSAALGLSALILVQPVQSQSSPGGVNAMQYIGVNIASGSFASDKLPGQMAKDYTYPDKSTIDYFSAKGMNVIRLTVLWERIQRRLQMPLHEPDMRKIDAIAEYAASKGMKTIVDVHNYAKFKGSAIGSQRVRPWVFADLWKRLALRYKDRDYVIFGLMNEPTGLSTEVWLQATNLALKEIRAARAKNFVLIPGNGYSSARDWLKGHYGTPNSQVMLGVSDPGDNWMFEVHQYFDHDFTGRFGDCQSTNTAIATLKPYTDWARKNRQRGFLGEFGVASNSQCLEVLDRVLSFLHANTDVWAGWAYWAAGPWWAKDYYTDIEPIEGQDRPQMAVLEKYIKVERAAPK